VVSRRAQPPRVLGIAVPRELMPSNLDAKKLARNLEKVTSNLNPKKLTSNLDLKDVVKQIGDAAEQVEARSEDLRLISAQAKRLSRKLS
jgi:hypothetical protein